MRELLDALVPFTLPKPESNAGFDLGRFIAVQVVDVLATHHDRMLGPQRPVADPGREIARGAEIDRVVAAGLGLDADELRRRGEQVGVLAALRATTVPVAGRVGETKVGERERALLAASLGEELARTLDVALPRRAVVRGRGAAAEPSPDALDALIEREPAGTEDDEDADEEQTP